MRRSSWIMLLVAVVLVAGLVFVQMRPLDTQAPAMTDAVATSILDRGKEGVQQRSPSAVLALTTPDAHLLGMSPDQMRRVMERAFQQMGSEPVEINVQNVHAQQSDATSTVTFNLTVGQRSSNTDAVYYQTDVTLQLRKVKIEHWFGLYSTEEWRIFQAESDKGLDVNTF